MKKFAPILLVVVLAALAIAATFWRGQNQPASLVESPITDIQSESNISNWKTYQNQKYGFEINYPPFTQDGQQIKPIEHDKYYLIETNRSYAVEIGAVRIWILKDKDSQNYVIKTLDEMKKIADRPFVDNLGDGPSNRCQKEMISTMPVVYSCTSGILRGLIHLASYQIFFESEYRDIDMSRKILSTFKLLN